MDLNWMPLLGEFAFDDGRMTFKGKPIPPVGPGPDLPSGQAPQPWAAAGQVICDRSMQDGRLSARVRFHSVSALSACELIIAFDPASRSQISAGLGGSGAMFSIREFAPSSQPPSQPGQQANPWKNLSLSGDRINLHENKDYDVEVRVRGSQIDLYVDRVHVASAIAANRFNQPRQVGVFCLDYDEISIADFEVHGASPTAFVVMEFAEPYDNLYSQVIKRVCEARGLEVVRADEIYGPGIIIGDVINRINQAQVIIADITPTNANVFFEVGYAFALLKPIVLLARRDNGAETLPFDVSAFRVLFYEDSIMGKARVEEGLGRHLREILGEPDPTDSGAREEDQRLARSAPQPG